MLEQEQFKAGDLLTVEEAAGFLGVAPRTIRAWIAEKRVDYVKILNGAVRIPRRELGRIIVAGYHQRSL
jgi:excisionase family DNA binding protein